MDCPGHIIIVILLYNVEGVPVTGYQYNITTVDGVLTNTITDTFIQYCPQVFGD